MGTGEAVGRGMAQGATFNFEPRIAAAAAASGLPDPPDVWPLSTGYNNSIRAPLGAARMLAEKVAPSVFGTSAGETYDRQFAEENAQNEQASSEHPWAYLGGNVAGGLATVPVAPSLMPFKMAASAPAIARGGAALADMALTGAGYGALAGAGDAPSVADMPEGAAVGGATGAVLGPAVGVPLSLLGKGLKGVYGHLIANPQKVADEALRRRTEADFAGLAKSGNPEDLPASLPELRDRMTAAQNPPTGMEPQPVTMSDLVGPQTQRVPGQIVRAGGEGGTAAETFLHTRQTGPNPYAGESPGQSSAGRTQSAVDTILGDKSAVKTADSIKAQRRAAAEPLYKVAHLRPVNYDNASGQELADILENAIPNDAKASANRILMADREGGNQLIWKQNDKGEFELVAMPNMRKWDYIQQGLQHVIDNGKDKFGDYTTEARAFIELREAINDALEENNSAFKAARRQYAGDSAMLDALRVGEKHWNMKPDEASKAFLGLKTPGEKEMYRLGAADAMRTKVNEGGHGHNKADKVLGTPENVKLAKIIAPDQKSYRMLSDYLNREHRMFQTRARATGNSQTAANLIDDAEAAKRITEAATMGLQAGTGHTIGLLRSVHRYLSKIRPEYRQAVMEQSRRVALNPDPEAISAFMDRLEKGLGSRVAARAFAETVTRGVPRSLTTYSMGQRERRLGQRPAQ